MGAEWDGGRMIGAAAAPGFSLSDAIGNDDNDDEPSIGMVTSKRTSLSKEISTPISDLIVNCPVWEFLYIGLVISAGLNESIRASWLVHIVLK